MKINTSTSAKVLVLTGDGINCERESALAFNEVGLKSEIIHINDLCERPQLMKNYDVLCLPGGFSFGDELGAGVVLAHKIQHHLGDEIQYFVENEKPIIGICNGFQALVRLGILPFPFEKRQASLTSNIKGHFINKWVKMDVVEDSICHWTSDLRVKKIKELSLPVRHGEGRIVLANPSEDCFSNLSKNGQIPFYYQEDFNGSFQKIAALCDPKGLILGMMPHPEAAIFEATNYLSQKSYSEYQQAPLIFKSISNYLKNQV